MYVSVCMILAHERDTVHPVANIFKMRISKMLNIFNRKVMLARAGFASNVFSSRCDRASNKAEHPAGFKILKLWLNTSCGLCLLLTPSISLTDWST